MTTDRGEALVEGALTVSGTACLVVGIQDEARAGALGADHRAPEAMTAVALITHHGVMAAEAGAGHGAPV